MLFIFQWQSYVWPLLIGTDTKPINSARSPCPTCEVRLHHRLRSVFAGAVVLTLIPLVIIRLPALLHPVHVDAPGSSS